MRSETRKLIKWMAEIPWFANVGKPEGDEVELAKDWGDAIRLCRSSAWQSVQLQVNNLLIIRVNQSDYNRFQAWNPFIDELDASIVSIIKDVTNFRLENNLPEVFQDSVVSDLRKICLEVEFSDLCPPTFFLERVFPYYCKGHFPCGWTGPALDEYWNGPMPEGKLVVY